MLSTIAWALGWSKEQAEKPQPVATPCIQPLSTSVKELLARGVRHNLKLVIRGARGTGKTALLHQLQGLDLPREYVPSWAISVATIVWQKDRGGNETEATSSPSSSSVNPLVKIEVWDVVDCGTARANASSTEASVCGAPRDLPLMPVDATTVDVYRNCNGAIFMIDVGRHETLDYARTEALKVPLHVPVLFCANFCDLPRKRSVTPEHLEALCRATRRCCTPFVASLCRALPDEGVSAPAQCIETSMATSYGMRALHEYISVPLAFLKISVLEERLRAHYVELGTSVEAVCQARRDACAPYFGAQSSDAAVPGGSNEEGVMHKKGRQGRGGSGNSNDDAEYVPPAHGEEKGLLKVLNETLPATSTSDKLAEFLAVDGNDGDDENPRTAGPSVAEAPSPADREGPARLATLARPVVTHSALNEVESARAALHRSVVVEAAAALPSEGNSRDGQRHRHHHHHHHRRDRGGSGAKAAEEKLTKEASAALDDLFDFSEPPPHS